MSAAHDHDHGHGENRVGHASEPSFYLKIWGLLLVLLAISVAGPELGIPVVTLVTAFGIAFVKAWMVIKHFMHLDVELPFVRYVLVTSLLFMMMFFAAVSVDVMNHDGARWSNEAAKRTIAEALAKGDPTLHPAGDHGAGHAPADGHAAPADGHAAPADGHAAPADGHAAPAASPAGGAH